MKLIILAALLASSIFAAEGKSGTEPTPQPAQKPEPAQAIQLDKDGLAQRSQLDQEVRSINLEYDILRKDTCWKAGLKPTECGPWQTSTTILVLKPKVAAADPPATSPKDAQPEKK